MPPRLASLDQFRGYTVLGMFLVNFVGGFDVTPTLLKHKHTFCSYADTVMSQFQIAVGFGLRLSFLRTRSYRKVVGRCLGLILLGCVLYHLTGRYDSWAKLRDDPPGVFDLLKRGPFETLTHIGVTTLWVLPVVAAPGWVRLLYAAASGTLHVWASHAGYYDWNMRPPAGIDGGPLGFLTWSIPLVAGTLAHDWVVERRPLRRVVLFGAVLMLVGTQLWHAFGDGGPPFVPPAGGTRVNYWTMSQRAGSVTYLLFASGFGLVVLAGFVAACDRGRFRLGYFDLLGRHALAGYVIHGLVSDAVKPFVPKDSPWWWVLAGFAVYLGVTTLFLRHLDRNRLYLKL